MTDASGITTEAEAKAYIKALDFGKPSAIYAAKRLGVTWAPWMGDWFVSFSPRNGNTNAEGPWDHWVDMALGILAHPFTQIVRPDAYRTEPAPLDLYDDNPRPLTALELAQHFQHRHRR